MTPRQFQSSESNLSISQIEEEQRRVWERHLLRQTEAIVKLAKSRHLHRGDMKAALRQITEVAADALEVDRVSAWLYKEENSRLICLDLYERSGRHSEDMTLEAANYPAYFQALEEERIIAACDAHTDPRTQEFSESYLSVLGITSMLDVPIWLNGQMVGVICYEHIGKQRQWTPQEEQFASTSADFLAVAMENSQRVQTEAQRREREQLLLSQYYEDLEQEVEERTTELTRANEQLQAEIAKRSQTEAALRRQQEEQQIIFDSVPAMIWRKDRENRILRINKAAAELTGFSVEEQESNSLYEIFPEQAEQYYKDDLEVIESGKPKYGIVEPLKTASGEIRWIRTDKLPYRDAVGNIVGAIVFAVDITERLQIEEELRQYQDHLEELVEVRTRELKKANEQLQLEISDRLSVEAVRDRSLALLHATLESTADGILAVSTDRNIVVIYNQKFLEMWGIPDEMMTSPNSQARLAFLANQVKEPEKFFKRLQELYERPDGRGYDILELKDGRIFERYSLPQRLGEQIIGRVWSFRDITLSKSAEDC